MDDLREVRKAISSAKRDFAGFIEGEQPNITEDQFRWLSYRMSYGSDEAALMALNMEILSKDDDAVPWTPSRIDFWRTDPSFTAIEHISLGNKREGFRLLSVHLAGKALRRIFEMLDAKDPKIVIRALTLWERTMGLLVDKVSIVDKDDLQRLAERLMQPVTVTPIEGPSIIDGEWTERQLPQPQNPTSPSNSSSLTEN